jgi:fibronectin type 3 domain-containing protein
MIRNSPFFNLSTVERSCFRLSPAANRIVARLLLPVLAIGLLSTAAAKLCAQNPATSVTVDASANQHPINPNIYGIGGGPSTADMQALNVTLNRIGGNNESDYNWQQDAINLDFDWYFESYLQHGPPVVPGQDTDITILNTRNAGVGAEPMVTIPMLPYIARVPANATSGSASLWSYSIAKYGAQIGCSNLAAHDPYQSDAGSGCLANGKDVVNDPTDAYVANSVAIETGYVQHLVSKWGNSTTSTGIKYYVLDNEPSLWSSTHRDVHPTAETYDEEYNNIVNYATAIRSVDPNAKIVGPEEWIWWAMWVSGKDQAGGTGAGSDYATHNNTYYYPYLLQKLYAYQQSSGIKMLDILTVHCYTDADPSTFNVATRQLWDPNYVDPNWESDVGINGGIQELIPLMKQWVSQYYPGLEIGCTEYSWGNDNSLGGATAQADALGIFGLYGFDLATQWGTPPKPGYLAMQIYRNYDGNLSTFGDTSVAATVTNPDNLSAFAALRTSDGALTVIVINKQTGSTPVTVSLANFSSTGTATGYQISSATQTSITNLGNITVANNAISATVPSQSVTLYVIPSGSVLTAPTTPTGLAATVGNGTVTLTWNAGGGATSYTVSRGSASTGPFTAIGTVTSPAPTTLTDTGLTNGTTYYYVVSGTNSKGTSPNSAPVAATPMVPPTFSSSATASPNPVTQNASTTITATVQCTANSLSNGTVEIIALDPSGNVALNQSFTAQSFTTSQSHTYTASLTPTLAGTYTLEVGVFSATGQQWILNTSAGTITVNSALSFTSSATPNPTSIAASGSSTVTVQVKDTGTVGLTNGIVQLLIIDPSGNEIVQQNWTSENFTAGATLTLTYTFTPSTLSPPEKTNGTYTFEIGVFNSTWSTDYYWNSNAGTITIAAGTAPAAPTGLTATAGNASVALSWTASSGATSYNVYRGTTAGGESTTPLATGITTTTYTDSTAVNGTKYYYKVAAVNAGGTSALSTEVSATPEPAAPAAPTGLTATAGNASVALNWTASGGATSYNVYRGTTAGGESTTPLATGITTTTYTDSTAVNGTTYYYKVAAVNAGGTSALSTEVSATPQSTTTTPATPTVTVDPASSTIGSGNSLSVKVTVAGSGATPTGSVTLSGGGYTSTAQTLVSGSYTFTIPSNSLNIGTDTLTASYGGDTNYTMGSGSASVTVTASVFSLSASAPSAIAAGSPATSTLTATTTTGYSGTISLACVLTSSPSGAANLPSCASGSSTITLNSGTTSGTATITVTSIAPGVAMAQPSTGGKGRGWMGGGAFLAFLVFLGIPARRRAWRSMLCALGLIAALGAITACSGGITQPNQGSHGTTAGSYTFTVTGTGTPAVNPAPTTMFTVVIQ